MLTAHMWNVHTYFCLCYRIGGSIAVVMSMKMQDGEFVSSTYLCYVRFNLTLYNFNTIFFNIQLYTDAFMNEFVYRTISQWQWTDEWENPNVKGDTLYTWLGFFFFAYFCIRFVYTHYRSYGKHKTKAHSSTKDNTG